MFEKAFKDIPVDYIKKAAATSPPPSKAAKVVSPTPSRPRCIVPGMCGGCGKAVSAIHHCDVYNRNMHIFCGLPV